MSEPKLYCTCRKIAYYDEDCSHASASGDPDEITPGGWYKRWPDNPYQLGPLNPKIARLVSFDLTPRARYCYNCGDRLNFDGTRETRADTDRAAEAMAAIRRVGELFAHDRRAHLGRIEPVSGLASIFTPHYAITITPEDMTLDGDVLWLCRVTLAESSGEAMGKDPVDALIDMLRGMSE